jgi:hypothetical protein
MKIENLTIPDISGCEADGWSEPKLRLRVVATEKISAIAFDVWFPEEEGGKESALFIISSQGSPSVFINVPAGEPTTLTLPSYSETGWDTSILLTCDNVVKNKGQDIRVLSFVVHAIRGIKT